MERRQAGQRHRHGRDKVQRRNRCGAVEAGRWEGGLGVDVAQERLVRKDLEDRWWYCGLR